jgi:hypothetical protein
MGMVVPAAPPEATVVPPAPPEAMVVPPTPPEFPAAPLVAIPPAPPVAMVLPPAAPAVAFPPASPGPPSCFAPELELLEHPKAPRATIAAQANNVRRADKSILHFSMSRPPMNSACNQTRRLEVACQEFRHAVDARLGRFLTQLL